MIYYANPVKAAVAAGAFTGERIGVILTPKQGNKLPAGTQRWTADNGCFGKGYPGDAAWIKWLRELPYDRDTCDFATAPDVVGDAAATLERSRPWLPAIREAGYRAAFVGQNGLTVDTAPWGEFDVLFLGGSTECLACDYVRPAREFGIKTCPGCHRKLTEWKLGAEARALTAEARRRGLRVHMGRVNSHKRLAYAEMIGCTSADGTFLTVAPSANLARVHDWFRKLDEAAGELELCLV